MGSSPYRPEAVVFCIDEALKIAMYRLCGDQDVNYMPERPALTIHKWHPELNVLIFASFDLDWLLATAHQYRQSKLRSDPDWHPTWKDLIDFLVVHYPSFAILPDDSDAESFPQEQLPQPEIIGQIGVA